jgi:hypothetical protein
VASFGPTAGGHRGTASIVSPSGSLTADVRVTVHLEGHLVVFGITADLAGATGRFSGARGTLTGSAPLGGTGTGVRHVDGRFLGVELSLSRSGVETVVGSVTRGSGELSGAHTTPLMVRGTRDLKLQRIATRHRGDHQSGPVLHGLTRPAL